MTTGALSFLPLRAARSGASNLLPPPRLADMSPFLAMPGATAFSNRNITGLTALDTQANVHLHSNTGPRMSAAC